MSYHYVPSLFRIPEVPGLTPPAGMWRGKGGDEGLFAMRVGAGWGGNVIVRNPNFCHGLKVGNSVLAPVFSDVNGYIFWEGDGYAYYTRAYGWVWCAKFPGYEPVESREWADEGVTWTGDRFYTFSGPPHSADAEVEMKPRGALRGSGEPKHLTAVWPRWVAKTGEFGVYEGMDGETGEKIKGLPRFTGGGEQFVRSLKKENDHFRYGRIHHADGKWVIGEIGSAGGWHEGAEPKSDGSVIFRFCRPDGSDAEGKDISVSLRDYVCGDETETAFLGSAATWR